MEKYQFLATLDMDTCSTCGALDGNFFESVNAKIGVNLPPMHEGCRCDTVSYDPGFYEFEEETRIARNPVTGKTYHVPASVTWTKWKETII